jgi:phenylalanine ammonia-lyase
LIGNPSIRVFDGPAAFGGRQIKSSVEALEAHGIAPIPLVSKEHLGILNGTAFSASLASLALNDAIHLTLLSQVLTAMGTEALAGTRASFDPFISAVRPHPGQVSFNFSRRKNSVFIHSQVETAKNIFNLLEGSVFAETVEEEVTIDEDDGKLRQDRYPLRTAPQFIGPQVEDLLQSLKTLTIECNSSKRALFTFHASLFIILLDLQRLTIRSLMARPTLFIMEATSRRCQSQTSWKRRV